jgi:hypothetical protein
LWHHISIMWTSTGHVTKTHQFFQNLLNLSSWTSKLKKAKNKKKSLKNSDNFAI